MSTPGGTYRWRLPALVRELGRPVTSNDMHKRWPDRPMRSVRLALQRLVDDGDAVVVLKSTNRDQRAGQGHEYLPVIRPHT